MQLTGTIVHATKEEQVTTTFKKRELIIETNDNPQYPQEIKLELHQDNVGLITGYTKGEEVICHCNLRGRGHVNKEGKKAWFNTIVLWKIERVGGAQPAPAANAAPVTQPVVTPIDDEDDDLPF